MVALGGLARAVLESWRESQEAASSATTQAKIQGFELAGSEIGFEFLDLSCDVDSCDVLLRQDQWEDT